MAKAEVNGKAQHEVNLNGEHLSIDGVRSMDQWNLKSDGLLEVVASDGLRRTEFECLDMDSAGGRVTLRIKGRTYEVSVRSSFDQLLETLGMGPGSTAQLGSLKAPMPGMVLDVMVQEGQSVVEGEPLLILEAMKMEYVMKSPRAGEITKVGVRKGAAIETNTLLVEYKN
jgi:biotin carboxyl carrier protein